MTEKYAPNPEGVVSYAGINAQGNIVAIMAMEEDERGKIAITLSEWIMDGLTIKSLPIAQLRKEFHMGDDPHTPHENWCVVILEENDEGGVEVRTAGDEALLEDHLDDVRF